MKSRSNFWHTKGDEIARRPPVPVVLRHSHDSATDVLEIRGEAQRSAALQDRRERFMRETSISALYGKKAVDAFVLLCDTSDELYEMYRNYR